MSLIIKIKILSSALKLTLSGPAADKTQYLVHLSFNSILPLISGISSDLQKLLIYFNGTAIVAFFRIPLAASGAGWAAVFLNKLALYLKDLNSSVFAVSASKLGVSSLE